MYAVRVIVEELARGRRMVVTNVPLKLPELSEYMTKNYPDRMESLRDRLVMLEGAEAGRFWLHRGRGHVREVLVQRDTGDEYEAGKVPDRLKHLNEELRFDGCSGVLYVIDEVHVWFNARNWQSVGGYGFFYLSQHRGLGDDVVLITQHPANVDRQFRSVAETFIKLRNLSKERLWYVLLPKRFLWYKYGDIPSANAKPLEVGEFRLDKTGLANCYDTSKKHGIPGDGEADTKTKRFGIPWWAAAVILCGLVYGATRLFPVLLEAVVGAAKIAPQKVASAATVPGVARGRTNPPAAVVASPVAAAVPVAPVKTNRPAARAMPPPPVVEWATDSWGDETTLTGVSTSRGVVSLWLSNGQRERFLAEVVTITENVVWVRMAGRVVAYRWPRIEEGRALAERAPAF